MEDLSTLLDPGRPRAAPQADVEFRLPGLSQDAEILVDRWGIPHIYARSSSDLFLVQGFNAARDRLWQLDLWRKSGLGLLAADFGPGYLERDRAARLFLYRGDMQKEWAAYGVPDAESIAASFVSGINAYIALSEANPGLLPEEFRFLGTRPQRWHHEDVVRIRSHALIHNVKSELLRARITRAASAETDLIRQSINPPWTPMQPDPLVLEELPGNLLDDYVLATTPATFSKERLGASLADAGRWARVTDAVTLDLASLEDGSNNWAVAGARTSTRRPILANDPHRVLLLPSLRYIVHLCGGGYDIIGAGEAIQPGVAIGHNGAAAFGLTNFPIDQEDVYVYETRPGHPDEYFYQGKWEPMTIRTETVEVKGAADQQVILKFSRHGPIVCEAQATNRAYAIRSVWGEPGGSAYLGSLAYQRSTTPEEFGEALNAWSAPASNHAYADRHGNIGRFAAAKAPIRPNWDGLYPVPGDGRYEWKGFHHGAELPRTVNPASGFVSTANEMTLPADYPYAQTKLGFEWADAFRGARIHSVLENQPRHSIEDSLALQADSRSCVADRICAVLFAAPGDRHDHPAVAMLSNWDHVASRESGAAALFEVWWARHLRPALLRRHAGDETVLKLLYPGSTESLIGRLEMADRTAHEVLLSTLAAAFEECSALLGPDPKKWTWGQLHSTRFTHPLSALDDPNLRNVGPLPIDGSETTVLQARYSLVDFNVNFGPSFKLVVDVGNWDASWVINAPGQSGDPSSPHFDDLAKTWSDGGYVPLRYSRTAVEAELELRIRLVPEPERPS